MRHILVKDTLKKIHRMFPAPVKQILIDMYTYTSSTLKGAKNIQGIKFDRQHSDACVIGNGPSLKKDRETLRQLIDTNDFICVNNFCDDELYIEIKPKVYIFLDAYFFSQNAHPDWVKRREKTFRLLNEKTKWPMKIIIPHSADKSILEKYINNPNIKIIKINTLNINSEKYSKLMKFLFNIGLYGPPQINVLLYGIYLAIIADYQTISIFGADLSFHKDVEVDQNTNGLFITYRHFNEKDTLEILKKNPEKTESFRMSELLELSARTFYAHEILNSYGNDKGVKIINYSSFSLIDAYPRSQP